MLHRGGEGTVMQAGPQQGIALGSFSTTPAQHQHKEGASHNTGQHTQAGQGSSYSERLDGQALSRLQALLPHTWWHLLSASWCKLAVASSSPLLPLVSLKLPSSDMYVMSIQPCSTGTTAWNFTMATSPAAVKVLLNSTRLPNMLQVLGAGFLP